jgi:hypothetical protein
MDSLFHLDLHGKTILQLVPEVADRAKYGAVKKSAAETGVSLGEAM